ncbi:MAG: sigma-54-dependent Fis family transcriptional regulator [Deltaproteobacteria bacterium]|nr:sigma-54-dependent Fis family transcriptional regulator [Deltaproteobacteria bacterium]
MSASVLLVEDDDATRASLELALRQDGFAVSAVADGASAIVRLGQQPFDVALVDLMLGSVGGLEVLDCALRHWPDIVVIVLTGYGTVETAVEAMKRGAQDFLSKPIDIEKLSVLIHKCMRHQQLAIENRRLRQEVRDRFSVGRILGRSPRMLELFREIEQVAQTDATVLLRGESGVGKELCANAIHYHGARHAGPLIKVAVGALGAGVLESELFGHVRGAFTGAVRGRTGRFEQADRGTIFLDEVGDIELGTQIKLLRVLQEQQLERVGGNETIQIDVRVIAGSNRDLKAAIAQGRFREDLYYRLNVVSIRVPALREHASDIPVIADHFLRHYARRHGRSVRRIARPALGALASYLWPGNVRELRNCIESLVVTSRTSTIELDDLPAQVRGHQDEPKLELGLGTTLAQMEREAILRTLALAGGNKAKAARLLGIGLKTLYRRLESYGHAGRANGETGSE